MSKKHMKEAPSLWASLCVMPPIVGHVLCRNSRGYVYAVLQWLFAPVGKEVSKPEWLLHSPSESLIVLNPSWGPQRMAHGCLHGLLLEKL